MWCEICSYGSEHCKFAGGKCPQCGNKTFEHSSPFPKKPLKSIRDMKKRVKAERDHKSNKIVSEEVAEVIKEAGSLK